jgi:glycosyltransferase involved in cell wall biosynthesis
MYKETEKIKENEKVSFCIPAYNSEETIRQCIESIVDLNYSNKEIIIVDDRSNDNTYEIIKDLAKNHGIIKYFHNIDRMGRGFSRQKALQHATGKYVALLDADGFITNKNWVETMLSDFKEDRIAGVFSLSKATNPENSIARYWDYLTITAFSPKQITRFAGTGNILVKKSVLEEVGGFDVRLWNSEDSDLSEKITKKGYFFIYEPDCLMSREQPSSINEVIKKEVDYTLWHRMRAYYNNNLLAFNLSRLIIFLGLPIFIIYILYRSMMMYIKTNDIASFWLLFFKTLMVLITPFLLIGLKYTE